MDPVKAEAQAPASERHRRYAGPTFERMNERANLAISQQPRDFRGAKAEKSGGFGPLSERSTVCDQCFGMVTELQ
jgi:hypothetical protein